MNKEQELWYAGDNPGPSFCVSGGQIQREVKQDHLDIAEANIPMMCRWQNVNLLNVGIPNVFVPKKGLTRDFIEKEILLFELGDNPPVELYDNFIKERFK